MRRLFVKALAGVVVLVAMIGVAGYLYLRQSLPVIDGERMVEGLSSSVEIVRDADNVPHIFASTKQDALYGLGYVHAQDRLWQMEFQRRVGHGRLSEIFGDVTVAQDRFLRTIGFGRAAHSAWSHLPDGTRRQIEAYVAGVNGFIATHPGRRLPPEFSLLRFAPAPFTGPDVLVWIKMMAWDLSANYSFELMRHDIAAKIGAERMAELMPPYAEHGLSILGPAPTSPEVGRRAPRGNRPASSASSASTFNALAQSLSGGLPGVTALLLGGARTEALGSNNWVVDGTLTATGSPLLANDPHLGTNVPSLWYLAHLSAGDFDLIGATLPGTPAVAIGRNRFIAWGETNMAADVEDFFLERIDSTGTSAEFRGALEPLRIVPETIVVKGAEPVRVAVRISRHGPILSDAINANNAASPATPKPAPLEPMAFRWTALDEQDQTVDAFMRLNEARNWDEFTSALRDFVAPSQNFVYADVDGHIGYYAPGRIPVRAGGDGSRPAEGWTGESEWTGWVPFEDLPHLFDPPEHFIVTANNRPTAAVDAPLIALEYPEPYRAQRIVDLIRQQGSGLTPDHFRAIQADTLSLHGRTLTPLLLQHAHPVDPVDRQAWDVLARWDFDARPDSAGAAIFQAWFLRLAPAIVGDELGPQLMIGYRGRFSYITRFVAAALAAGDSVWCDDTGTPSRETCDDTVTSALHDGVADLVRLLGGDVSRWRWDGVHRAVFPHQGLDAVGLLRPLLSRSLPNGGDWSTVNVGPVAADTPYEQHSVPGYRQIVDLSPANDSRFLDAVGQSGHFLSKHYDDSMADWQAVRHRKMRMDRAAIEQGALGRLRLIAR
ncbi:MAG: penicillin acylase family protein [Luteitalea sp.]|nr:penicillin acylase family protein [Luteitalea sp.]